MIEIGYIPGNQQEAEELVHDWGKRDFKKLMHYCKKGDFFQDVPFSYPYTYVVLDYCYPNSKFMLTVLDNAEQWYNSLTNFNAKRWGKNGRIPTKEVLQYAFYRYKGSPWDNNRLKYTTPEDNPYIKEDLMTFYESHNRAVKEYFRHRPEDLLVLNVAEKDAYKKLCDFLGKKTDKTEFPWNNKTSKIKQQK